MRYDEIPVGDEQEWTEEEIMEAEAEMEVRMLLPASGVRCGYHPHRPAVKMIRGDLGLCAACCENISRALIAGITPDVGTEQAYQEWENG